MSRVDQRGLVLSLSVPSPISVRAESLNQAEGVRQFISPPPFYRPDDDDLYNLTPAMGPLHICVGGEGGYLVEQNAATLGKVKTGRN